MWKKIIKLLFRLSLATLLGGVRGKKKKAGGSTRNQCGFPPGRMRGLKVYDGQRVPSGKVLVDQITPNVTPGWNVSNSINWRA